MGGSVIRMARCGAFAWQAFRKRLAHANGPDHAGD
jgi:hypothetical protein